MKKTLITILATVLVCCCVVGGTLAWLTDKTEAVKNVFTVGDIEITLTESDALDLKIIPGKEIAKDPVVTVKGNSEACWLFVKIEETNWSDKLTYNVNVTDAGWTLLETGVYYRKVSAKDTDQEFYVLDENKVTVANTLTSAEMETMANAQPTLTITAYAVQQENIGNDPATAWATAKTATNP